MGEIETLTRTFQEFLPAVSIINDADELRNYGIDGLLPLMVSNPTTINEAAQVVSLVNKQDLTIMARGGGSQINLGGIPDRLDVMLDTRHLDQLLEHEAPDLTCHIEAGMTLAALQKQLAEKGQRLSLDPPNAEQATLGGILSSNAYGPKRLRYGTARDLVIGLRVIQANGEITRSGGKVVKNVAGYDLNKLYIGSLGTLGIIVEANFKLHPIPQAERTMLLTYTNATDVMHSVIEIQNSLLIPSALELIDPKAANDLNDFFGIPLPSDGYTLAVNFEGSQAAIERQLEETELIARKHHVLIGDDIGDAAQDTFWEAIREHTQGTVTCKAAILVSQVAPYLQFVEQVCRRHELEASVIAHAGNGILYIDLRPGDATPRLVEAIIALRQRAHEARGSLIVECCPADLKRRISVWGLPGSDFFLMQRLKNQFDPKGTFVRGRFVGGL